MDISPNHGPAKLSEGKNTLIVDFLKRLRIAISNAAVYSPGHHISQKSFEELKNSFDQALGAQEAIEIFIAPRYLLIKGQKWEKDPLYEEIARFFHQRCLKTVKFERGVSVEEISFSLSKAVVRPKDIFKQGGLMHILQSKNFTRISVEPLDYSEILKSGKEDKDIWAYLLSEAIKQINPSQIDSLVDYYDQMIKEVGIRDFLTNREFQESIFRFLDYLKGNKEYAFRQCGKIMMQNLIKNSVFIKEIEIPQIIAESLECLSEDEIADIVIQEFLKESKQLEAVEYYADIFNDEKHKGIIDSLAEKLQHQTLSQVNREGLQGFQKLLLGSQHPVIVNNYRPVISTLIQEIVPQNDFRFDKDALSQHYLVVMQYLLTEEEDQEHSEFIQQKMVAEFEKIPREKKIERFKSTFSVVSSVVSNHPARREHFRILFDYIGDLIEEEILAGHVTDELGEYVNILHKSTRDVRQYLDIVLGKKILNPLVIRTFFKFFPEAEPDFYRGLKKRLADTNFLLQFIRNLTSLEPARQLGILKVMFSSPNAYIKTESLNIMKTLPVRDQDFLFSILMDKKTDNPLLRERALEILAQEPSAVQGILDALLTREGVGRQNLSLLEENVKLVKKLGLRQARDHLVSLHRNLLPWQRGLKKQISGILNEWDHG